MSSKLKLSTDATTKLEFLSSRLNLRRNIICRIALGMSLNVDKPPSIENADYNGQEFNKSTIIGLDELIITALIADQFGKFIDPEDFFSVYVRAEVMRGLDTMSDLYTITNSPVDFIQRLCYPSDEEFTGMEH
jgi:DNA sulfur modification protein DndE